MQNPECVNCESRAFPAWECEGDSGPICEACRVDDNVMVSK